MNCSTCGMFFFLPKINPRYTFSKCELADVFEKNVEALQQRATTVDEKGKDLSVQAKKAQLEKWRVKAISQQEKWTVKTILYKEDTEEPMQQVKSYGLEAKNLEDILRSKNLRSFQSATDETRSAYSEEEKETL